MPSAMPNQITRRLAPYAVAALILGVCVSGLSADDAASKPRVRIQAVQKPTVQQPAYEVIHTAAKSPSRLKPVVRSASLSLIQPAPPETGPGMTPAPTDPPTSPSDQILSGETDSDKDPILEERGKLFGKDDSYFKGLTGEEREILYDSRVSTDFGIGQTYEHQNDGKGIVPPPNTAAKLFAEEGIEDYPYGYRRDWYPSVAIWEAPAFYHRPLYFEEVNLERYGHRHQHLQPVYSVAHFFGNALTLPYQMGAYCPCERVYTLGHHRPGDCNPHDHHSLPWSPKGAVYMGAFYTSAAFALP